jgi:hypothetical protein
MARACLGTAFNFNNKTDVIFATHAFGGNALAFPKRSSTHPRNRKYLELTGNIEK